jgi:hypothetical protein
MNYGFAGTGTSQISTAGFLTELIDEENPSGNRDKVRFPRTGYHEKPRRARDRAWIRGMFTEILECSPETGP